MFEEIMISVHVRKKMRMKLILMYVTLDIQEKKKDINETTYEYKINNSNIS